VKVSTCVDCTTTILGEALRCPACHDKHAHLIADDAITVPRSRVTSRGWPHVLLTWLVGMEIVASIIAGIILATRGC
jgi:hypothetical protein